jgi:hypothetical protein
MTPLRAASRPVVVALLAALVSLAGCGKTLPPAPPAPPPSPTPSPSPTPAPPDDPLAVQPVAEPIVIAAWAEPPFLPVGGGQTQILVKVQKRGGRPYPGVEVRLHTSAGSLYSAGKVLVTGANGMTRDRLTAKKAATVTLNAGGTRYRFEVPLEAPPAPE